MADTLEKIGAIIPSTYYDIIARVIPGAATIGMLMWVKDDSAKSIAQATGVQGLALAIVGIGLAYLVGLLLTPLGSVICEWPLVLIGWLKPRARFAQASSAHLWQQIAEIDAHLPNAGITLAKMAAEATLCQNLLAGTLVVWVLSFDTIPAWKGTTAVVAVAVNVVFRTLVFIRRVDEVRKTIGSRLTPV